MGLDLKVKRMRARLTQEQLGAAMGVTRVRIGQIEGEAVVSAVVKGRYLAALDLAKSAKAA